MQIDFGFGLFLLAILIWISVIDLREYRIPNELNLVLFSLGFAWQLLTSYENIGVFVLNSGLLFTVFFCVRYFYKRLKNIEGMGLGDVKMAGAAGIWFSPLGLPIFLFTASATGLVFTLLTMGIKRDVKIPFGPFLAAALFVTWLYERTGF